MEMTTDWARTILTQGGCGLAAKLVHDRDGGEILLRYDSDRSARHAAVRIGREIVHWGDNDEGFEVVSEAELLRAIKEDFRSDFDESEVREALKFLTGEDY